MNNKDWEYWERVIINKHTVVAEVTLHNRTSPQIITPYSLKEDLYVDYYWGTGPSRCSSDIRTINILADYGEEPERHKESRKWWNRLNIDFLTTYYPTTRHQEPVPDFNESYLGWISPEGDYIVAAYGDHDGMARIIYLEESGELLSGIEAREILLEEMGWVILHGSFILGRSETEDLTKQQYDMIMKLSEVTDIHEFSYESREIV